ncbi:MAG TPA: Gfo/Idh/MocA family oxidoreductase [Actinomycetes bacterium]|nr:Gfo/Idh/MocA family oxidoreductase [Actinomycetes bacterium]
MNDDLRFGLVGTGYWATETHARGIAAAPGASLSAVWGRNPTAADTLASSFGARSYEHFEDFLGHVDAVSFSVPPDVQAPLAVRAANAGKHLLLEKPIALDEPAGDKLVAAVESNDIAALVFFTHMFSPPVLEWFEMCDKAVWLGGDANWLGSALISDNPFNTPWRRVHGGLWDVGPHVIGNLQRTLGPIVGVTTDIGSADVTHLVLHHETGATSTSTLTLSAPDKADGFTMMLWGPAGRTYLPIDEVDSVVAHTHAAKTLVELAESGRRGHPADVRMGRDVLRLLATAQRQIDAR